MKAYPTYKDSGVQWLGNIPTHWKIVKLRNLLHKTTQKGRPDLPLLSVVREQGVILRDVESKEENHNYIPDDLSNYKVLRDGQFVINKMKAWQGSYSVSSLTGIVSPAYFIYDVDYTDLIPQFFNTAIRSRAYIGFFNQASDGVRIGQWDLDEAHMRNIPLFVPTLEEQNAIVDYLDKKCAEIEELISRRQAIIERLKELKQSIIAEAVTKGLNPEVPMKESGIDWIPDIPVHWKVVRLRNLLHKTTEKGRPDLPLLSVVRELGVILRDVESKEENHNYIPDDLSNYKVLREGQFVINKMKAWQGSYSVSSLTGIVSPAYFIYDVDYSGLTSQFFNTAIRSKAYIGFFNQASDGVRVGQWDLDEAQMRNIPLFVPTLEEQNAIVAYLDKKCAEIDELVARQEQIIEKLKELKTSTIAHVVTGKVDVRDAI